MKLSFQNGSAAITDASTKLLIVIMDVHYVCNAHLVYTVTNVSVIAAMTKEK